jgi:hypothetical protein
LKAANSGGDSGPAYSEGIKLDTTPPITNSSAGGAHYYAGIITLVPVDAQSGVARTDWMLDGVAGSGTTAATTALGPHRLTFRSTDLAGNIEDTKTVTFSVVAPTSVSVPSVSPSRPTHGKYATFTAWLSPAAAAFTGPATLELYRYETKTVHKKVRGRVRHVRVKYWRLRSAIAMTQDASGRLTARTKPRYSGKWRARVVFGGSVAYLTSTSGYRSYTVR